MDADLAAFEASLLGSRATVPNRMNDDTMITSSSVAGPQRREDRFVPAITSVSDSPPVGGANATAPPKAPQSSRREEWMLAPPKREQTRMQSQKNQIQTNLPERRNAALQEDSRQHAVVGGRTDVVVGPLRIRSTSGIYSSSTTERTVSERQTDDGVPTASALASSTSLAGAGVGRGVSSAVFGPTRPSTELLSNSASRPSSRSASTSSYSSSRSSYQPTRRSRSRSRSRSPENGAGDGDTSRRIRPSSSSPSSSSSSRYETFANCGRRDDHTPALRRRSPSPDSRPERREESAPVVGDGGAGWRRRIARRQRESEREGFDKAPLPNRHASAVVRSTTIETRGRQDALRSLANGRDRASSGSSVGVASLAGPQPHRRSRLSAILPDVDPASVAQTSENCKLAGLRDSSVDHLVGEVTSANRLTADLLRAKLVGNAPRAAEIEAQLGILGGQSQQHGGGVNVPGPVADNLRSQNQIAADIVRARMSGNAARVESLQRELEASQSSTAVDEQIQQSSASTATRVAPLDSQGRPILAPVRPAVAVNSKNRFDDHASSYVANGGDSHTTPGGRRRPTGERTRWFADDDALDGHDSIAALVERERISGPATRNMDEQAARAITSSRSYAVCSTDEQFDDDAGLVRMAEGGRSGAARHGRTAGDRETARQHQQAIAAHQSADHALSACWFCLSSRQADKRLVVAVGTSAYLALPKRGSLTPGHCLIVPSEHIESLNQASENSWEEIRNFRKCLVTMFERQGKECIFFETSAGAGSKGSTKFHAHLECVPLPREAAQQARGYFKKALLESTGTEWSMHKKVIEMKPPRPDIRRSVPAGFPYFSVEFGMQSGFAHVIEDRTRGGFPRDFARGILGGLLELDEMQIRMLKRQSEPSSVMQQRVSTFAKMFAPVDWTAELNQQQ